MRWIKVEDNLPEAEVPVIVFNKTTLNNPILVAKLSIFPDGKIWHEPIYEEWSLHLEDVTHWMPLPKPPSKG